MSESGFECKSVYTWLPTALSEQRFDEDSSVSRALLRGCEVCLPAFNGNFTLQERQWTLIANSINPEQGKCLKEGVIANHVIDRQLNNQNSYQMKLWVQLSQQRRVKTDEGKGASALWKEEKDQICLAQGTQPHIKPSWAHLNTMEFSYITSSCHYFLLMLLKHRERC